MIHDLVTVLAVIIGMVAIPALVYFLTPPIFYGAIFDGVSWLRKQFQKYQEHSKTKLLARQFEESKKKMMDDCIKRLAETLVVVDGKVYRKKNTAENNK